MRTVLTVTLASSIALVAASAPVGATPEDSVAAALGWLRAHQQPSGCIASFDDRCAPDGSAWSVLAFRAAGVDPATVRVTPESASLVDYVASTVGSLGDLATSWERTILAAVAAGGPGAAYDFGGTDLVAQLLTFFDGQQFGPRETLTDDYFAVLALRAAGFSESAPVVRATREWILLNQQPNGGWSWGSLGPENEFFAFAVGADVDDTAAALQALAAAGPLDAAEGAVSDVAVARGLGFVKSLQFLDGGCGASYVDLAFSAAFGGVTGNADSTSWAIMGLHALGEDAEGSTWTTPTGANLASFLASLQQDDGSFVWKPADPLGAPPSTGFIPVSTTAWATIALAGEGFLVVA